MVCCELLLPWLQHPFMLVTFPCSVHGHNTNLLHYTLKEPCSQMHFVLVHTCHSARSAAVHWLVTVGDEFVNTYWLARAHVFQSTIRTARAVSDMQLAKMYLRRNHIKQQWTTAPTGPLSPGVKYTHSELYPEEWPLHDPLTFPLIICLKTAWSSHAERHSVYCVCWCFCALTLSRVTP